MPREQRVVCRLCHLIFWVPLPDEAETTAGAGRQVEAVCPCCEGVAIFTEADTLENPNREIRR